MISIENLTSRERLLSALNHKEPDRIPIDLGGFQTGIHINVYRKLIKFLGIQDEITIMEPVQQLAEPCEEVLNRFHIDTRYVNAHAPDNSTAKIERIERDGKIFHEFTTEFGDIWAMQEDHQLYMEASYQPLADASVSDLRDYPFPDGGDPSRFTGVREQALNIRNNTSYALCIGMGGILFDLCWFLRGMERWFMDIIENQEFCEVLLDRVLKYWLDYYSGFMAEVGDLIDVVMIGDDFGGQSGPLYSPVFFHNIVKPRQKKLISCIKSLTSAKIWHHSCGSCAAFIPDLIDNGVDILNPVQISADNMDPQDLKDRFGEHLSFWGGGVDAQKILPFASSDEVQKHVKTNVEIFMKGGGYVFSNVHNIQSDVPPENIVAMFDAAYEYGFYK